MRVYSTLSIAALALCQPAWTAGPPRTISGRQSDVVLPAPLGRYPVSIYDHEVKTERPDPLAPTAELRRLIVTVYRPFLDSDTCPPEHQSLIPYFPAVVADALLNGLLGVPNAGALLAPVRVVNCSRPIPPSSPSGPLLLFSPGYGGTHHGYAAILQSAASAGYTVVAIDHTYESAAVVFPDGFVAYPGAATDEYHKSHAGQTFLQAVRINDSVSVLNAIERGEVPGLGRYSGSSRGKAPASSSACRPLRAVMYGHSFGGSTAVNVAAQDPRVLAGANMDGNQYPPASSDGAVVSKPLLIVQSAATPFVAENLTALYEDHARGWKSWVRPNGTTHYSFTDLPLVADLLGLRGTPAVPNAIIGTVNSRRLQEIMWRYTLQFFSYVLTGATPDLLEGPSADFADVEFVGHAGAEKGQ